jgi:hypothetical protein
MKVYWLKNLKRIIHRESNIHIFFYICYNKIYSYPYISYTVMKDLTFLVYKIEKSWFVKDSSKDKVIEEGKTKKEVIAKVIHALKGQTNSNIKFFDPDDKVVFSRLFVNTKYRKAAHKMRKSSVSQKLELMKKE